MANVTGAALTTVGPVDRRAWFVASAEKYIEYFLKGFASDGYCSEGIGYWNYGFGHYVMLAETLYQQTDGRIDLMAKPLIKEVAQFGRRMEILPGVYPAFADCSPNSRPVPWLTAFVNRRFRFGWNENGDVSSIVGPKGSLPVTGLLTFPNSISDRPQDGAGTAKQPLRNWFPEAGILICRPKPGAKRPLGVALKGGHNAEHHNHNDVGSYVFALGKAVPLVDPGAERYTRRTFSSKRYVSNVLNSFGHPVPRVAGQLQRKGREAAAKVLDTQFGAAADRLVLDLRSAYDVEGLKRLERTFVFSREGDGGLTVTDRIEAAQPETFETALITFDPWRRLGPNVLRVGKGGDAVDVEIDTGGLPFDIRAEEIKEDLHGHSLPTRLGIALAKPVIAATVTLTIRPSGR